MRTTAPDRAAFRRQPPAMVGITSVAWGAPDPQLLSRLSQLRTVGVGMLIHRWTPDWPLAHWLGWAALLEPLCAQLGIWWVIHAPDVTTEKWARAVACTQHRHYPQRWVRAQPVPARGGLVGLSCHNDCEIQRGHGWQPDYLLVSPVLASASHADSKTPPLGWAGLARLTAQTRVPVYALGGMMSRHHLHRARQCHAQGIAGISLLHGLLRRA